VKFIGGEAQFWLNVHDVGPQLLKVTIILHNVDGPGSGIEEVIRGSVPLRVRPYFIKILPYKLIP